MSKHIYSLGAIIGSLLLTTSVASAHVVVKPDQVGVAAYQTFTTSVPNEKDNPTIGLRLVIPSGLKSVTPTVKLGWTIQVKKDGTAEDATVTEIDWTNGSIPAGQRDDFTFSAQAPATATSLDWKAYQTYADGTVVSWDQDPNKAKVGDESTTPYSVTHVVNDLTSTATTTTSTGKDLAFYLGLIALVLSIVSLVLSLRRRQ